MQHPMLTSRRTQRWLWTTNLVDQCWQHLEGAKEFLLPSLPIASRCRPPKLPGGHRRGRLPNSRSKPSTPTINVLESKDMDRTVTGKSGQNRWWEQWWRREKRWNLQLLWSEISVSNANKDEAKQWACPPPPATGMCSGGAEAFMFLVLVGPYHNCTIARLIGTKTRRQVYVFRVRIQYHSSGSHWGCQHSKKKRKHKLWATLQKDTTEKSAPLTTFTSTNPVTIHGSLVTVHALTR